MDSVEESIRRLFGEIRTLEKKFNCGRAGAVTIEEASREIGATQREVRSMTSSGKIRRCRVAPGFVRISEIERITARSRADN